MALFLNLYILFVSTVSFSQEGKRFVTMGEVFNENSVAVGYGMMNVELADQAGKYNGYGAKEAISNAGFKDRNELQKQLAFATRSEFCLRKLNEANQNSRAPVRYYGDSSELMIHVNGTKVNIYTSKGMIEIEGTNCKAVDGSKNVVDGLINIAQRAVSSNLNVVGNESEDLKKTQSQRVVDMLQACGQVDSKFETYSNVTLKEKYKVEFQDRTKNMSPPVRSNETQDESVK